jgi:hypothetical protein
MTEPLNTHGYMMQRGRHKDTPITRVPVNYLKWMVNVGHEEHEYAKAELQRRGTVTPTLDVSGHAIDRASLSCRDIWHQTRNPDEGLHAWMVRRATEALEQGEEVNGRIHYGGMKWCIERECEWPVVKTVMRINGKGKEDGTASKT